MRKFNSTSLPYLASVAQSIQFAHAGYILDSWPGLLVGVTVGAVVSFSVATAASRISDIAKSRRPLSYAGLVALLILSPAAIAGPSFVAFGILTINWVRTVTACAWAIAPDAAILLSGAIAGKSLVSAESAALAIPAVSVSHKSKKQTAAKVLEYPCKYSAAGCGRMFASQNAANAHAKACKFIPVVVPDEWRTK